MCEWLKPSKYNFYIKNNNHQKQITYYNNFYYTLLNFTLGWLLFIIFSLIISLLILIYANTNFLKRTQDTIISSQKKKIRQVEPSSISYVITSYLHCYFASRAFANDIHIFSNCNSVIEHTVYVYIFEENILQTTH